MTDTKRMQGRRALITGAASGIGRATARLFLEEGARVALCDLPGTDMAATLGPGDGLCLEVDVTDEGRVAAVAGEAAAHLGGIDAVVNAAGFMMNGAMAEVDAEAWRRQIDVNLTGPYLVARACLPWLAEAKGATVVNIASAQGLLPSAPRLTGYAASKGGLIALTKSMAAELAPDIRVNCVCPGMVDTPMAEPYKGNVGHYALGRMAEADEIARAILFLTSTEGSYVTGAALAVDGGRSFH